MAFDEALGARIRTVLTGRKDVVEKRMFGGLAFMVGGHMAVGIIGDDLMARIGPDAYTAALREAHVRPMDFVGKPMAGYVYVGRRGIVADSALRRWVGACTNFVATLPAKKVAKAKRGRAPAKPRRRRS